MTRDRAKLDEVERIQRPCNFKGQKSEEEQNIHTALTQSITLPVFCLTAQLALCSVFISLSSDARLLMRRKKRNPQCKQLQRYMY